MTANKSCAASTIDSMSNRATIRETFDKERYSVSQQDKGTILSMVQMKIWELTLKLFTNKELRKGRFSVEAMERKTINMFSHN